MTSNKVQRTVRHWRRLIFFVQLIWIPMEPMSDESWLDQHWRYALDFKTAWKVSGEVWFPEA